jgi:hypothetical protein
VVDLVPEEWTHELARFFYDRLSEHVEDWQGIPISLPDLELRLHGRHPLAPFFARHEAERDGVEFEIRCGGPEFGADDYEDEAIVNYWFSAKLNCDVYVYRRQPSMRSFVVKIPRSPDSSMDRLTFWMTTIGASDAWDEKAEHRARWKLRSMLSDRQWRHYDLTGCFFETSSRSRLTYIFRRSRPTIVLTPRWPWWKSRALDRMKCLAVLCLHPIGYYSGSWGGCMVPSDDVIAHLLLMRSDEAGLWKAANQHEPWRPEAGL